MDSLNCLQRWPFMGSRPAFRFLGPLSAVFLDPSEELDRLSCWDRCKKESDFSSMPPVIQEGVESDRPCLGCFSSL